MPIATHQFQEMNLLFAETDPLRRTVASANVLTAPGGSGFWDDGHDPDQRLLKSDDVGGAGLHLRFASGITNRHANGVIELAGAANFVASAKATLTLAYHNSVAYEIGRKA